MADQRMKSTEKPSICNWFIESARPNNTILLINNGNIPGSSYAMTVQCLSIHKMIRVVKAKHHHHLFNG